MSWQMTGGYPKIGGIDARAFAPIPVVLLIQGWTLLILQLSLLLFLFFLGKYGYTFEVFYLYLRRKLAGDVAPPYPMAYIRCHDSTHR